MFDWFKKNKEPSNVVPFPDHRTYGVDDKQALPLPEEPEKPATVFYRLGVTDKNRVSLQMGYSEITMNKAGVQNLIDQLSLFRDQLVGDENEN